MDWRSFIEFWSGSGGSGESGSGFGNFTSVNDTLSCVATSIMGQAYPYPFVLSVAARTGLLIHYVLLLLTSVPMNAFVIFMICKCKSLRTISFVLVLQVAIIDLVGAAFHIPLSIISAAANKWLLGEIMCTIAGVMFYAVGFTRTEVMLCFVIDRFLLVFMTYTYPKYRLKTVVGLSIVAHVVPIVLAIIPAFLGCYAFAPSIGQCHLSMDCSLVCALYRGIVAVLIILPSCVVPLILYAGLFLKANKLKGAVIPAHLVATMDNPDPNKTEMRATITFFLMFVVLFAVTAPHAITYLIGSAVFFASTPPIWYRVIEGVLANVVSLILVLDAVVLMRNTDVKDEIAKIDWLPVLWC